MRRGLDDGYDEFFVGVIGQAVVVANRVLGDHAAAEDAAVEALARAHLRWGRLRDDPHRRAWVLRVAINAALDAQRSRRRRAARDRRYFRSEASGSFEADTLDQMVLAQALRALPARQREAVTLRYLVDLPEAEVAAVMRVTLGSIKVHLHRGLETLGGPLSRQISGGTVDV